MITMVVKKPICGPICEKTDKWATWHISVLGIDNEENSSKVVGITTVIARTLIVSFHLELII